jgi:hypothetical protein
MEQLTQVDSVTAMLMQFPESVRLLKKGEYLPASLEVGLDLLGKIDPDWIWIATRLGLVTGVLAASPCHGVAVIWRVIATEAASGTCVLRLLRRFLKDIKERQMLGYVVVLDQHKPIEMKLAEIVKRYGGKSFGSSFMVMASSLSEVNW